MALKLEDYLLKEGHFDGSKVTYQEFLMQLREDTRAEYQELADKFCSENTFENITQFYDHGWENGTAALNENGLWHKTTTIVPIIESHITKGSTILDMGCAEGLKTVYYAKNHPENQIYGNDIRIEAVKRARQRAKRHDARNAKFIAADNLALPFDGQIDLIISDHSLHETASCRDGYPLFDEKIVRIAKALKLGGTAIIALTPCDPDALEYHLGDLARWQGLTPEFSRLKYTKFGNSEEALILVAKKSADA